MASPKQLNGSCCSKYFVLPCIRTIKWIPVLFITLIMCWSYYAYVYVLCWSTVESSWERAPLLLFYHIILILFMWSYYQVIMMPTLNVPKHFKLTPSLQHALFTTENENDRRQILDQFSVSLPLQNKSFDGSIRFCEKCYQVKPDRSHHCSVCGQCVLKMDHHCPWINNCVSFTNYKCFILFLGYALTYCIYVSLSSLKYFIMFWEGSFMHSGKFHILFLCFVAAMFSLSLFGLFGYHLYLVANNKTTLEAIRAPIFSYGTDKLGYHLGVKRNFIEVFGYNKVLWFLPIQTHLGDGIRFPTRGSMSNSMNQYNSMGITGGRSDSTSMEYRADSMTMLGGRADSKNNFNSSNLQLV